MEKKTVLAIFGGTGMEYYVGCDFSSNVMEAIDKEKYNVLKIGITPEGKWLLTDATPSEIRDGKQWLEKPGNTPAYVLPEEGKQQVLILEKNGYRTEHVDVAFPIIPGYGGEDGRIQGMLDMSGIPYVGSGMISSALSLDKEYTFIFAKLCGLKIPKNCVLHREDYARLNDDIDELITVDYPMYVKPMNGGSSMGISKATNKDELLKAVELAFKYDRRVIIEEEIEFRMELKASLLGNENPKVGALCEMVFPKGMVNDYNTKYKAKNPVRTKVIPATVSEEIRREVERQSRLIYKRLDCKGMARVDFFLTDDDEIYFNEINTIPGMGRGSIYSKMFNAAGVEYETMVQAMLDTAENESLAVFNAERG